MKIVIADDISDTLDMVCSLVKQVCPQAEIIGKHTTLEATKKTIDAKHPDIVLLDIQFSAEGKTAFDLLEHYKNDNSQSFRTIIFSGHCEPEYYDMAFCFKAVHFLPKPIDKERLKDALERTTEHTLSNENDSDYRKNKLIVNTYKASHFITLCDLVYLQSKDTGTHIKLINKEIIKSSRNLGFYEKQLSKFDNFVRIHNNTIVNIDYVQGISNKTERDIILKASLGELKASREKFKEFMEKIKE